jgi:DNA-binding MarR family transcriptional regulator
VSEYRPEESLGYLLNRAARLMAQSLGRQIAPLGVTVGQWAVLLFLYEVDDRTQAELSRLVAIEPPTMVRTIDRLVRDGLVERQPDPRDGRATRILLTDKARQLRDPLMSASHAVNADAMAVLGTSDGDQVISRLRALIAHLSGQPSTS